MNISWNSHIGKSLHTSYLNAKPFSHMVFDNFLGENFSDMAAEQIYSMYQSDSDFTFFTENSSNEYMKNHQVNKFWWTPDSNKKLKQLEEKASAVRIAFDYFYSIEFLDFLKSLTGIKEIITDLNYEGGGIHNIRYGGKLDMHIDFNHHPQTNNYRVLNVLYYLPSVKDLKGTEGGQLKLEGNGIYQSIIPKRDRLVVFTLSDTSYHGHPDPWISREGDRNSLAFYYYIPESNQNVKYRNSVEWI